MPCATLPASEGPGVRFKGIEPLDPLEFRLGFAELAALVAGACQTTSWEEALAVVAEMSAAAGGSSGSAALAELADAAEVEVASDAQESGAMNLQLRAERLQKALTSSLAAFSQAARSAEPWGALQRQGAAGSASGELRAGTRRPGIVAATQVITALCNTASSMLQQQLSADSGGSALAAELLQADGLQEALLGAAIALPPALDSHQFNALEAQEFRATHFAVLQARRAAGELLQALLEEASPEVRQAGERRLLEAPGLAVGLVQALVQGAPDPRLHEVLLELLWRGLRHVDLAAEGGHSSEVDSMQQLLGSTACQRLQQVTAMELLDWGRDLAMEVCRSEHNVVSFECSVAWGGLLVSSCKATFSVHSLELICIADGMEEAADSPEVVIEIPFSCMRWPSDGTGVPLRLHCEVELLHSLGTLPGFARVLLSSAVLEISPAAASYDDIARAAQLFTALCGEEEQAAAGGNQVSQGKKASKKADKVVDRAKTLSKSMPQASSKAKATKAAPEDTRKATTNSSAEASSPVKAMEGVSMSSSAGGQKDTASSQSRQQKRVQAILSNPGTKRAKTDNNGGLPGSKSRMELPSTKITPKTNCKNDKSATHATSSAKPEAMPQATAQAKVRGKSQERPPPKPEATAQAKLRGKSQERPLAKPEATAQAKVRGKSQERPLAKPEATAQVKARGKSQERLPAKPEATGQAKARGKSQERPLAKQLASAQAKAWGKSQERPPAKPEATAQAKARGKSQERLPAKPEATVQAKARGKSQERPPAKPEATAQVKARGKSQERPLAKQLATALAKAQAKFQGKLPAKPEATAQAKARAKAQAKSAAKLQATAQSKAQAKAQAKLQAKALAKSQAKPPAKPQAKPQAKAQAKAQAKSQCKPQAKAQAKATAKAKTQSKQAPQAKTVAKNQGLVDLKVKKALLKKAVAKR